MSNKDPVIIVSACRTAIGNFNGYYADVPCTQLGATVLLNAYQSIQLDPDNIDDVIMGCVLPAGLGQAPARQAAIAAELPKHVNATTVNKMCGSGMKTVMLAHDMLLADSSDIIIAGGMENMTRAPYLVPKGRFGYRLGHGTLIDHMMLDGLEDAYDSGRSMGTFAETCAEKYGFTREQQDEFALNSLHRAQAAQANGAFKTEIVPITLQGKKGDTVIDQDEGPCTAKADKIPQLKPAFQKGGTVTAANASSISDGAATLTLMRRSTAEKLRLKPLATIVGHAAHAQDSAWFTTAPIHAISALLKKIDWSVDDVDLFEINEAFAVVAMAAMQDLHIPHEKLNVHGGACVLGHPIGASGARILVTLLHAMQQKQCTTGVASLCIGGGEATAIALKLED